MIIIGIIILLLIVMLIMYILSKKYTKEEYEYVKNHPEADTKFDGCSGGLSYLWRLFYKKDTPWESCCDKHDRPYFLGGTSKERLNADKELKQCVANTGNNSWANLMYSLVRIGGTPLLPFPWRWGFGKPYYTPYD